MSESKIFKVLGEYISQEEKSFGDIDKVEVKYKQPNSTDPSKVWTHQAVVDDLSPTALDILSRISAGERFCVHNGKVNGYPAILDITDASDAPAKSSGGKAKYNNKDYKPRDESGVAVGAAYKDVKENVALLTKPITFATMDEIRAFIKEEARKIIKDKQELEAELRAAKKAAEPAEAKEEKPKSKLQLAREAAAAEAATKTTKTKAKKEPEPVDEDPEDIEEDDADLDDSVNFGKEE